MIALPSIFNPLLQALYIAVLSACSKYWYFRGRSHLSSVLRTEGPGIKFAPIIILLIFGRIRIAPILENLSSEFVEAYSIADFKKNSCILVVV